MGRGVDFNQGAWEVTFKLRSPDEKQPAGRELVIQRGQQVQRP